MLQVSKRLNPLAMYRRFVVPPCELVSSNGLLGGRYSLVAGLSILGYGSQLGSLFRNPSINILAKALGKDIPTPPPEREPTWLLEIPEHDVASGFPELRLHYGFALQIVQLFVGVEE